MTRAGGAQLTPLAEKFMPEAVRLMKPGGSCRFEVPPAIGWGKTRVVPNVGEDETTIWRIDLVRILRLTPLDPDKTKRTASGLEYEVLAEGSGASPGPGATVLVHYIGWLEEARSSTAPTGAASPRSSRSAGSSGGGRRGSS